MPSLPTFVRPMLARPAEPFDSPEHLFEVKWDGMRALVFIQGQSFAFSGRASARCCSVNPRRPRQRRAVLPAWRG